MLQDHVAATLTDLNEALLLEDARGLAARRTRSLPNRELEGCHVHLPV
jgi:hypothetical protein